MNAIADRLRTVLGISLNASTPLNTANGLSGVALTLDELIQLRLNTGKRGVRRRKKVSTPRASSQRSRALGRGLDFAEVRTYQPGDDVRMIDWKVTARTNQVHTKLFEEERERPVFIVVDFCQPMLFGTRVSLKSVAAARLAAQLAWICAAAGERIGGVVFGDQRHVEVKPISGARGALRLLNAMVELHGECVATAHAERQPVRNGAFADALLRLRKIAHPGAMVFILSDFAGLTTQDQPVLQWLCTHTECTAVRIVDALELQLPTSGLYPVTDGVAQMRFNAGEKPIHTAHREAFVKRAKQLNKVFVGHGSFLSQYAATQAVGDAAHALMQRNAPAALSGINAELIA